jgi:tetratricopeptide (TPR) repeat protein
VGFKLNMSAGEFFDLIRPVAVLISALISAWVLASARKRFPLAAALGWTLGTLLLPLVVLPIYLAVLLLWRRPVRRPPRRFVVPLIYGAVVIVAISVYFYVNNQSVDAHLARATEAKLNDDTAAAIREYRRALELEENPHTRKLLAIQLAQAGYLTDAISEFRLAQEGGEPDDTIHFDVGVLLQRLEQNGQARLEFQEFLLSPECMQFDSRCDSARERIKTMNLP